MSPTYLPNLSRQFSALEAAIRNLQKQSGVSAVLPHCKLSARATGQSLPNNVVTVVDMDTADEDPYGLADLTSNRINIPFDGVYRVDANLVYPSTNTTGVRAALLYVGPAAGNIVASDYRVPFTATNNIISLSAGSVRLVAGDSVGLRAFQNSGAAIPIVYTNNAPWLSLEWVSA